MSATNPDVPPLGAAHRVLTALLLADIFLLAVFKLGDYDIWYYLAAGRHIAATGTLMHAEPFAYTAAGRPWHLQTWLASLFFHHLHSLGGVALLIMANAAVVATVFAIVFQTMRLSMRRREEVVPALALVLLAAFTARFRFVVRPHVLEFLLLALTVLILESHRRRGGKWVFALPVLQAAWVNTHGSHVLGLLLPAIYLAGALAGRRRSGAGAADEGLPGRAPVLGAVLGLGILATLANPYTWRAFTFPFLIVGQTEYMRRLGEWQPLAWRNLWGYGLRFTWGFVFLGLLAAAGIVLRRGRMAVTDGLLLLAFLVQAVMGIRLLAEFGIIAAPVVLRLLAPRLEGRDWAGGRPAAAVLGLALLTAVPAAAVFSPSFAFGPGIKEDKFPEQAVRFVERSGIEGRMFNSFAFGDYLCWRVAPRRQVFIHGRNDIFPESFFLDYYEAQRSPEAWARMTAAWGVTWAILQYSYADYGGMRRGSHLASNPEWVPVYWDMTAAVYVKRVPANERVIDAYGYRYLRPAYFDVRYLYDLLDRVPAETLLAEADRLVRESPRNEEAWLDRAVINSARGGAHLTEALADARRAVELNPRRAMSHAAVGSILRLQGRSVEAERAFRAALRLDPRDPTAAARLKAPRAPAR